MLSPRPSRQSGEDNLHPLNPVVANLKLLSIKAESYHWNVTGANFGSLHKLFEDIDTVADDGVIVTAKGSHTSITDNCNILGMLLMLLLLLLC